jgi:RNA polymerase sigma factor (TIGR02999 family)
MNEVARILSEIESGDPRATEKRLPLVYDELRRLAAVRMANERADHTLDDAALVQEAYLRLIDDQQFEGQAHFFAAAAEAMRWVLVDYSRNRARSKRGCGKSRIDLDRLTDPAAATDEDLLALDESLAGLARRYAQVAELVKLRFFAGMTLNEAAEALDLSLRTANRHWAFARAWLAASLLRE